MKALLDTNIILHRETNRILNENIGQLFLWLDKLKYTKVSMRLLIKYSKHSMVQRRKTSTNS